MPVKSGKDHYRFRHGQCPFEKPTRVHRIWSGMRNRCSNKNNRSYFKYGGRGITVCERWEKFENFYADMGDPPTDKHQIERKKNNEGYSLENCRWATPQEQASNRRSSRLITIDGRTQTLMAWCREKGLKQPTASRRINDYGWTEEQAIMTPAGVKPVP